MTTSVVVFLVIVSLIFGALLYSSIKDNKEIENEKKLKAKSAF
jgi:hypothetical protein